MAVYRAPFPTPESRRPTWRLLRQDILFIEPPTHQPACASSMVEYTSASFVAGFLHSSLVAIFRDEKTKALRETSFQYRKGPPSSFSIIVVSDRCFWAVLKQCGPIPETIFERRSWTMTTSAPLSRSLSRYMTWSLIIK